MISSPSASATALRPFPQQERPMATRASRRRAHIEGFQAAPYSPDFALMEWGWSQAFLLRTARRARRSKPQAPRHPASTSHARRPASDAPRADRWICTWLSYSAGRSLIGDALPPIQAFFPNGASLAGLVEPPATSATQGRVCAAERPVHRHLTLPRPRRRSPSRAACSASATRTTGADPAPRRGSGPLPWGLEIRVESPHAGHTDPPLAPHSAACVREPHALISVALATPMTRRFRYGGWAFSRHPPTMFQRRDGRVRSTTQTPASVDTAHPQGVISISMRPERSRGTRKHHRTLEAIRGNAGDAECEVIDCDIPSVSVVPLYRRRANATRPVRSCRANTRDIPPPETPREAVHDSRVSAVTAPSILTSSAAAAPRPWTPRRAHWWR